MEIRAATEEDDDLFVHRYLAAWATEDWPDEQYFPDAAERVRQFMQDKRRQGDLGGFVLMDGATVAGLVGYHLDFDPYPRVIQPKYLLLAYVWDLWVEPAYRGQGLGRRLMEHVVGHLRGLGCNGVVLHHVEDARAFYEKLGFGPATELRLAL